MQSQKYTREIDGKSFEVALNNWAQHASGSVTVRLGDTVVLVTAVMNPHPREGGDFFPLSVEYEEKYYATGRILGSRFMKRESRPSEEAILAARLIDRTIRPRFDLRMRNEIQIVVTVLSIDDEHDPDILGILGASLALSLSDIPWQGPVAGVRVAKKDDALIINPIAEERLAAVSDIIICGTRDRINMLEAGRRKSPKMTLQRPRSAAWWRSKSLSCFKKRSLPSIRARKNPCLCWQPRRNLINFCAMSLQS